MALVRRKLLSYSRDLIAYRRLKYQWLVLKVHILQISYMSNRPQKWSKQVYCVGEPWQWMQLHFFPFLRPLTSCLRLLKTMLQSFGAKDLSLSVCHNSMNTDSVGELLIWFHLHPSFLFSCWKGLTKIHSVQNKCWYQNMFFYIVIENKRECVV